MTEDYHKYVFQDGKFVGAFEELYQKCDDPWHQLGSLPYANQLVLWEIRKHEYHNVLDVGCGLGRFSEEISGAVKGTVTAIDISPTAIGKARERTTRVIYQVLDVTTEELMQDTYDLIVVSELFWYVLDRLNFVMQNLEGALCLGGRLMIIQQFYQPGQQKYGNEILSGPVDLLKRLPMMVERMVELDRQTNHKCIIIGKKQ